MELNLKIQPLDEAAMAKARERQAQLAKPPGSLGRLEDLSVQLAGITGKVHNRIEKKHLLVFAADNGVVAEGVSSAPQSVTLMQTINLTRHKTGASTLWTKLLWQKPGSGRRSLPNLPEAWDGWKIYPSSWQASQERYITKSKRSICWYSLLTMALWQRGCPQHPSP